MILTLTERRYTLRELRTFNLLDWCEKKHWNYELNQTQFLENIVLEYLIYFFILFVFLFIHLFTFHAFIMHISLDKMAKMLL